MLYVDIPTLPELRALAEARAESRPDGAPLAASLRYAL